jgi:hypothetical protein
MSTDRIRVKIRCVQCDREGARVDWSDDWGRSGSDFENLDVVPNSTHEIGRQRVASAGPICACGSKSFVDVATDEK